MNLLVDIGNTRLKWAVSDTGGITAGPPQCNHALNHDMLADAWRNLPPPRRMAVSCVSARQFAELAQSVAHGLWPGLPIVEARSSAQAFGVRNAYAEPEKLGVDRWLALLAAHADAPGPACIVDCGTAITVDWLDVQGHHLGGMICPGLALMKMSLNQNTRMLPYNDAKFSTAPANHTEAAIYSGVLNAAVGLVERALSLQPEPGRLILTGGDAQLLADELHHKCKVDADLVLRGLALVLGQRV